VEGWQNLFAAPPNSNSILELEKLINSMSNIHKSLIALLKQVEEGSVQLRHIKKKGFRSSGEARPLV